MRRVLLTTLCVTLLTAACGTVDADDPTAADARTTVTARPADDEVRTTTAPPTVAATTSAPVTTSATTSATPSSPPSPVPTTTPTTTPTPPAPTPSSVAPAPTTAPPTTATAPPSATAADPVPGVECSSGAYSAGPLRTAADAPAPVVATARTLLESATACDVSTLVALAHRDGTEVSRRGVSVEQALDLPDVEGRYLVLATLLSGSDPALTGTEAGPQYRWPAAAGSPEPSQREWRQLVDAGLYSQADVDRMRRQGGYTGWQVGISADGAWDFFIAGP